MSDIKLAVEEHGWDLPQAPSPLGAYQATIQSGNLLFISGQLPIADEKLMYKGQLGKELSIEEGYAAARLCALNLLSQLDNSLHGNSLKQIIRIDGVINSCESFEEHASVLNGASDLLSTILLDKAGHVRTVMGCTSLPNGAAVELSAIVEIKLLSSIK